MRQSKRRSASKRRNVGIVIGAALFVCLPALVIAGVFDCASDHPGLHCSIVKLAFDGSDSGKQLQLQQATAR